MGFIERVGFSSYEGFSLPSVIILRPNVDIDADLLQFPNVGFHYDKIDKITPDYDDTYIYLWGVPVGTTESDIYGLQNLSAGIGSNVNVQVKGLVRREAQNPAGGHETKIQLGIITGGIGFYTSFDVYSNNYTTIQVDYPNNPNTGNPWTSLEIDALLVRLYLSYINTALADGGLISGRCTQIYAEVG